MVPVLPAISDRPNALAFTAVPLLTTSCKRVHDEKKVVMESLLAFKRAGSDDIISYYAMEVARWLNNEFS